MVTPNLLDRQFDPVAPYQAWVTDITYIRTYEGWLYLGTVMDLLSRPIIRWSMGSRMTKELVLDALLMAVWRRKPKESVLVHSDQGSQYTSHDWSDFLKAHGLESSMSRRGNCHDNAVGESFSNCTNVNGLSRKYIQLEMLQSWTYLTTSRCFITRNGSTGSIVVDHLQNMSNSVLMSLTGV